MTIRAIKTDEDLAWALQEFERASNSDEGDEDRQLILGTLIDAYERQKYVMDPPDPVETLKFEMERRGLSVSDLVPFIGQPNRVYEVLAGKRGLSIQMIRRLHRGLGIPLEVLITEPKRASV